MSHEFSQDSRPRSISRNLWLKGGLYCLTTALIIAGIQSLTFPAAGFREIVPITIFTVPLAIGIVPLGSALRRFVPWLDRRVYYLTLPIVGGVAGIVWSVVVYGLIVNPYFGVYAIPVGLVWMSAGAVGMVPVLSNDIRSKLLRVGFEFVLVIVVGVSAGVWGDELISLGVGERELSTVWIGWCPGDQELALNPAWGADLLTEEEQRRLRSLIGGEARIQSGNPYRALASRSTPVSRMIVVMQHPIDGEMQLKIPLADARQTHDGVIYIQKSDGSWRSSPTHFPNLDRELILISRNDQPRIVEARYRDFRGTRGVGGLDFSQLPACE